MKANRVRVVDGNSVVRDLVVRGEVKVELTDTGDINVALEAGARIAMVLPDHDGMGVPMMPTWCRSSRTVHIPRKGAS